jgi:hypothetical protein
LIHWVVKYGGYFYLSIQPLCQEKRMSKYAWFVRPFTLLVMAGLLFGLAVPQHSQAQAPALRPLTPVVGHSLYNDTSPALRDIIANLPATEYQKNQPPLALRTLPKATAGQSQAADGALQQNIYPNEMPLPVASFDGISNPQGYIPPDTNGDIGYDPATNTKYYFMTVNVSYQFWDVTDPTNPTPVTGVLPSNALWQGSGQPCASFNDGDPIGLFDSLAHRWIFSQFGNINSNGPYYQCTAISATADPLGAWYRYSFVMPGADMNDYPKFGVWPDAYYMTDHQFYQGNSWDGSGVFAFDRVKMLAGLPATYIYFNLLSISSNLGGHLPADFDGLITPPAGAPGLFIEVDDSLPEDGGKDIMRIWEFHADFVTPANSTFGTTATGDWGHANYKMEVAPYTYMSGSIPQKNTSVRLDSLGDRLMYRLAYRNLGDHQIMVVNHTVNVNGRAGVRWYEVQNTGSGWTLQQQGTFAPTGGNYRWMGSIASDASGNLALGYSISNSSMFPSINYTGRLAADPLGQMAQGESNLVMGTGSQTDGAARWGDYSAMSVDPQDDCTFWYTTEYLVTTSPRAWHTNISSFAFPGCTAPTTGTLAGVITNSDGGAPLAGATITVGAHSATSGPDGHYSLALSPGNYDVTASLYGFLPQTSSNVPVLLGQTTTRNFAMLPRLAAVVSGVVSDASGHGYPLYARLDISAPGFSQAVFTNPATGAYQANLFQGLDYTFNVSIPAVTGYSPQVATVTPNSGAVTRDFNMLVDPACTTPGYHLVATVCTPIPGGLVTGFVTDLNTGVGLVGAEVKNAANDTAITFATPQDPNASDGLYLFFQSTTNNSDPEAHDLTASMTGGYSAVTRSVNVQPDAVVVQDFALPAGLLAVDPTSLDVTVVYGQSDTRTVTITNNGTAAATFTLQTLPLSRPGFGPFAPPTYAVKPFKQGYRTAQALNLPPAPDFPPFNAGTVKSSWSAGLSSVWGVAADKNGQLWVSSPSQAWGGDASLHGFTPAGAPTGTNYAYTWDPINGPADLAYNVRTGTFWIVSMAEWDNCIYEISPESGFTGGRVCPGSEVGFRNAQRGLAYDPATDTYYAGGWNDLSVYQFSPDGTLLRSTSVGLAISGLAYNPDTHHLFALVNADPTQIYVLDTANGFARVGAFTVGQNALGAYAGAGLEMACDGSLWLVDQSSGQVYNVTSGETTSLCTQAAPWLGLDPTTANLQPGQSQQVTVTFYTLGFRPGLYTGQIKVVEDTPYNVPNLPVTLHNQGTVTFLPGVMKSQ